MPWVCRCSDLRGSLASLYELHTQAQPQSPVPKAALSQCLSMTWLWFWWECLGFELRPGFWDALSEEEPVLPPSQASTHRPLHALEFCSTFPWLHDQKCSFSNFISFLFSNDRSFLLTKPPLYSFTGSLLTLLRST